MGLLPIIIDTGDEKRDLGLSCGAEHFVDFKKSPDVTAEVIRIADNVGVHAVIVTAPGAYSNAIDFVGKRVSAKVMCIGLRKSKCCLCSVQVLSLSTRTFKGVSERTES